MNDSLDLFAGEPMPEQPNGLRDQRDYWRAEADRMREKVATLERQLEDTAAHVDDLATVLEDHYGFASKKYRHSRTLAAVIKKGWKKAVLEKAGSPAAIKAWLDRHERNRRPLPGSPSDLIHCYLKDCEQRAIHEGLPKHKEETDA